MPEYRLYYFEGGHIRAARVIVAPNDSEAEVLAAQRLDGRKAELWRGAKMLRTFKGDP